jgi:Nif-specific regulatory protein
MDQVVLSTGAECLDKLLGGLHAGDNVVWEVDSGAPMDSFIGRLLRATEQANRHLIFVSLNRSPQAILKKYLKDFRAERFFLVDCFTSGKGRSDKIFSDFYEEAEAGPAGLNAVHISDAAEPNEVRKALEDLESQVGANTVYVFDSITGMFELWNEERKVLNFFAYMCPRLYDLNTVAYWILEKEAHSEQFLANLRHVTQVVIELSVPDGRPTLLLRKAEGRPSPRVGIPQGLTIADGMIEFTPERREELEMAVLSDVSQAIGSAMELERVFEQTMEVLARELKMRRGTLVLLDKVTNELRIVAAHGLNREEKKRGRYRVGEGVTGKVVQTGQPMAIADISKDPLFLNRTGARAGEKARGRISFVCVPLRIDAEVVGAISVDRDFVDEETLARDQRLLQIIASLVSQAIRINRMVMVEREQLLAENLRLRKDLRLRYKLGNIVAASGAMQDVVATAATVAKSNATVLIRGETGTGKELVASVLHYNSGRANGPFVKVNCGALPETLLETELFGHVRGAFTGAVEDRKGRFELAHKGTVFLDEVSNMSERLQVKLLRVLQEREFERVGGTETIKADVRVVAATNADLEEQVAKGTFREDLFYRLNVIPIFIPPLRERREDIPFLVEHFLEKYNRECGKSISKMSQEVLDALTEYPWPGNVRELESCIERAVVLSQSGTISMNLLPINIRSFKEGAKAKEYVGAPEEVVSSLVEKLRRERRGILSGVHGRIIARVEKALLEKVLQDTNYVQTRAAKELGLSRNTLRKKMEEYGILSK